MMITNLFVIANVQHLRTDVFFLNFSAFFRTSWDFGDLNSAFIIILHNRVV